MYLTVQNKSALAERLDLCALSGFSLVRGPADLGWLQRCGAARGRVPGGRGRHTGLDLGPEIELMVRRARPFQLFLLPVLLWGQTVDLI